MIDSLIPYILIVVLFILSLIISSVIIRKALPLFSRSEGKVPREVPGWYRDLGFWIGFFETLIIFIFVANNEYSGLAIIFAAKEFVRKEEIKKDPVYYLLGTLINFGISLLMAEIAMHLASLTT